MNLPEPSPDNPMPQFSAIAQHFGSIAKTNRYKYFNEKGEHVHTLDSQPLIGTSRVVNVIAKPLTWYGSGQAVKVFGCPEPKVLTKIKNKKATQEEMDELRVSLAKTLAQFETMSLMEYQCMIDRAYRAHDTFKKERAVSGTDIHAECEHFIKDEMLNYGRELQRSPKRYEDSIQPFIEWSRKNVKRYLWSEGHCYSEKHWIGGISDAGYEKLDGTVGILDFKSTREAYVPQFWQCAGYDLQISENGVLDKDGNMLYDLGPDPISEYCIFAFGADKPKPYFFEDPKGAQEAFLAALTIYQKLPQE